MRIYRVLHEGTPSYARTHEADPDQLELLTGAPWLGGRPSGPRTSLAHATFLAPMTPSKIVCVGRNYAAHAKELGNDVPSEPLLFLKPPSALIGPGETIALPPTSAHVEHEAEIGLVIGARLSRVEPGDALAGVFGVTAVNDVTARDLQRKDVQFTRAKSFDTFCPVGPCIAVGCVPAELGVIGRVNGQVRQQGRATQMIFGLETLVSFISEVMTLEPGDLIATGTPAGVGPLTAGDVVEIEVTGVGVLQNGVAVR